MNTECMYRINRNKKGESIASCAMSLAMGLRNMDAEIFPFTIAVVKKDTKALSEVYENKFYHKVRKINLRAGDVVVFVVGKLHHMYEVEYTSVKLMFPDFDVDFDEFFEDIYKFANEPGTYDDYACICSALRHAGII